MANNNRNNTKVSFWKKLFDNAAGNESANNLRDEQQQTNIALSNNLSPKEAPTAAVEGAATEQYDSLSQSAGLTPDDNALISEPLDEVAQELAAKDIAIQQLEEEIIFLEERSAKLQQEAVDTLSSLADAEQRYNEASQAASEAAATEAAVREKQQQRFAAIEAENEVLMSRAEEQIATVQAALANRRQELSLALAETDRVALNLGADQDNSQTKQQAKVASIGQSLTSLQAYYDDALAAQEASHTKINSLQFSVKRAQNEYDRADKDLVHWENRFKENKYDEKLAAIANENEQNQERLNKSLEQINESFSQQIDDAKLKYEQLATAIEKKKNEVAANEERITAAYQAGEAATQEHQRLQAEKETIITEADAEIQLLLGRIEAARKDVEEKKDAYTEAQKQVQLSTSISVKANAQASAAREKADKAAIEKADAATAAEMAQKLKADATVARVNTDEASSLLLSRAEMVLLNTAEKAIRLLEEKTSLAEIAEQEAVHLRSEADLAAAEAKRATGVADKMISLWLSAEENLVKITTETEENKRQVEERTALAVEQYEQSIAAAQQTITAQQNESLAAVAACDKAKSDLAHCQDDYAATEKQIADLQDQYAVEKIAVEKELADSSAAAQRAIADCQEERTAMLAKIEDKRAAFEYRESQLTVLVDELNCEQEKLSVLLEHTEVDLQRYQDAISQSQSEHQLALAEMNALIHDTIAYLSSCRSKAERVAANVSALEKDLQDATASADKAEEDAVDRLLQVRNEAEQEIADAVKVTVAAKETAENYYAQLQEARLDAENKVKAAVDASIARLDAVNRVACQYTEKELFCLDNDINAAEESMLAAKAALEESKNIYLALDEAVISLSKEKADLTNSYDHKYQDLTEQKDQEIALLDQEIAFLAQVEKDCQSTLAAAHTNTDKIVAEYAAAQERLHACLEQKDELSTTSAEQLAELSENYRIAMEGEGQDIPLLRTIYEDSKQKRDKAIAAFADADLAWRQQVETTAELRNNELAYKQDSVAHLEQLKANNVAQLQNLHDSITALETQKKELDAAYAKSQAYAQTNATALQEAEGYLQKIVEEEQQEQIAVDNELHKINDHLQLLKEDAEAKEQKYRTTANIVKNSQQLMKDAEESLTLAKNAFTKVESEMNAAEAAYKTSQALADQAAQSYFGVDNDTAAILKRASEELVVAADNAAVFVEEKKKDYLLAEEAFKSAQRDFDEISQTISEAPALADANKDVWLKADEEYQQYKHEAEQQTPAIKNAFANFLAERARSKAAAKSTVEKCVKESEETKRNMESISGRVMETLSEISRLTSEKQALENNIIENEAQVEQEVEDCLLAKKEARENAEELSSRLEMVMLQRKEERDSALEQFSKAKNNYQLACANLDQQYNADKEDIENKLAKAVQNEGKANFIFTSTAELRKKAAAELAIAQERYQTVVEKKEQSLMAKAKLVESKDAQLHELTEVKIRVLGNNAIARIAAEEKAAKANKDYLQKKALFEEADKAWRDLLQQRDLAKQKLATLQEDGERAIAAAQENILYMMKDATI